MKKKSILTMLVIALMFALSLAVLSACGDDKDDNKNDPPVTYSLNVTGGTGGGEYAEGATVTITADAPETGKEFGRWEITGLDTSGLVLTNAELTFTMPASDVTATALYSYIDYKATVVGGTAQVDADAEPTSEVFATYECPVSIFADTAPTGQRFVRWTSEDGVVFDDATSAETTFTMPAGNVTVTANYDFIDYTVKVTGGTADKTTAHYGDSITITAAAPETGKRFTGWTLEGVTVENTSVGELTFTMPAGNVTATANYDFEDYAIKVTGGWAQVNDGGPFSTNAAHYGDNVKIKAHNPGTGMKFKNWTITGVDTSELVLTDRELTFTMPANAVTATANYEYIDYTVTITGGTANKTTAHYGEEVTITAEVPVGKEFVMWSFDGLIPDGLTLTDAELTFTMPANDVTATAELRDLVECDVTVTGGVTQVGEGTQMTSLKAYCGDTVTLTAYQYTDKTFVKWTIEGIDTEGLDLTQKVLTFIMPENNVTATAEFENVPTDLTFEGDVATSGELRYVNYDSKSFRLPLGDGQDRCTYTIELSNSAFTFKVYGSVGEVRPYDNGEGIMCIDIDYEDNYTIEVINTGLAANCTLTVTKI